MGLAARKRGMVAVETREKSEEKSDGITCPFGHASVH